MWKDNGTSKIEDYQPLDFDGKLTVEHTDYGYFIYSDEDKYKYLHPNGNIYIKNFGYWETREEAENFLKTYIGTTVTGCTKESCICDIMDLMRTGCPAMRC